MFSPTTVARILGQGKLVKVVAILAVLSFPGRTYGKATQPHASPSSSVTTGTQSRFAAITCFVGEKPRNEGSPCPNETDSLGGKAQDDGTLCLHGAFPKGLKVSLLYPRSSRVTAPVTATTLGTFSFNSNYTPHLQFTRLKIDKVQKKGPHDRGLARKMPYVAIIGEFASCTPVTVDKASETVSVAATDKKIRASSVGVKSLGETSSISGLRSLSMQGAQVLVATYLLNIKESPDVFGKTVFMVRENTVLEFCIGCCDETEWFCLDGVVHVAYHWNKCETGGKGFKIY